MCTRRTKPVGETMEYPCQTCSITLTQTTVTAAFNINTTIKPTTATID